MDITHVRLISMLWSIVLLLNSLFLVELEASHHVFKNFQTLDSTSPDQPYRTAYHFQPPKNWMNDPNGPMIYKGIYHLFYQYNPKGAVWGNIVWAHSTSTDLVNWTPQPIAFSPSQPYDIFGCWSGSATILPGEKPMILYTGADASKRQTQNLAMPKNLSDPFLREWVKHPNNPLMKATKNNMINASSFRDPTTAWLGPDKYWRVIIGSKRNNGGLAILYKSKDFVHWNIANHPLHYANNSEMWECPDLFPVSTESNLGLDTSVIGKDVKYVLKISLDIIYKDYYTIGTYNPINDIYTPDKWSIDNVAGLRFDYGKYYASKTFFDSSKKRRILWGWLNESSSVSDDIRKGWAGIQAIPRTIWLHKSGKQLLQWPVKEIEQLRTDKVVYGSKLLKGGSLLEVSGITAVQADVEISFSIGDIEKAEVLSPSWTDPKKLCDQKGASVRGTIGPFGLLVFASKGLEEYTAIFFRIFKAGEKYVVLMCSDQSRSSLDKDNDQISYGAFLDVDPVHEKLSLKSLIDHSIVESFGGDGKACISARVYPTLAIKNAAHLYAFNNGTQPVTIDRLTAWSMKRARIN